MPKFTPDQLAELVQRHMRYDSAEAIERFEHLVRSGCDPVLASMHATRSYPGVVGTDTQFRQDNQKRLEKVPKMVRDAMLQRRGYSGNAVFHHQLGEWVESESDIKKAAQRKNLNLERADGKVLHQGHYVPQPRPPLAEHIVRARMLDYAAKDPSLVATDAKVKKLREDVINKHTPHWRKKDTVLE